MVYAKTINKAWIILLNIYEGGKSSETNKTTRLKNTIWANREKKG